ncbi:MAG TPA: FtsW/RodA/SpoVE family cell cycle protein, partial [Neobacillus sp.]
MEKYKTDRFDWTLTLLLFLFFLISCAAIYSAQSSAEYGKNFLITQIFWYVIGAGIISGSIFFDSYQYKRLSWYFYGLGLLLLIALIVAPDSIAPVRNGAKSWFIIKKLGSIQPSEFVKVFLILALSRVITDHQEKYLEKSLKLDFFLLFKLGFTTAVPLGLIMLQPDLGTGLVILAILTGLILVSGISWKIIFLIYGTGASLGALILYLVIQRPEILEKYLKVQSYQFNRIYAWLDPANDPQSGYHLMRSLSAIGSGLLTGKGFDHREVYVPEGHTDFIFSVIGEEYGFVGGSIVI